MAAYAGTGVVAGLGQGVRLDSGMMWGWVGAIVRVGRGFGWVGAGHGSR